MSYQFKELYSGGGGIIEVDALPTENIEENAFYFVDGKYYKWYELAENGTWVFNDVLSIPEEMLGNSYSIRYSVNDPIEGELMLNAISFGDAGGHRYMEFSDEGGEFEAEVYHSDIGWYSDSIFCKTIEIHEMPTDSTFLAWLTANAKAPGTWVEYVVASPDNDIVGFWVFDGDINHRNSYDLIGNSYKLEFYVNVPDVGEVKMNWMYFGYDGSHFYVSYYGDGYNFDFAYSERDGWSNELLQIIKITEAPTDEAFIAWLRMMSIKSDPVIGDGKNFGGYFIKEDGENAYIRTETKDDAIVVTLHLDTRVPLNEFGNAQPSDVRKGVTFTSSAGVMVDGTKEDSGIIEVDSLPTENIDQDVFYLVGGKYYKWKKNGIVGTWVEYAPDNCEESELPINRGEPEQARLGNETDDSFVFSGSVQEPTAFEKDINLEVPKEDFGDAERKFVRKGKTFTSKDGYCVEGTMPIYDFTTLTAERNENCDTDTGFGFEVYPGYNNYYVDDYVYLEIPKSELGNAQPSDVRKGVTFTSSAGVKVEGTNEYGAITKIVGTWLFRKNISLPSKSFEVEFISDGSNYSAMEAAQDGLYYSVEIGDWTDPAFNIYGGWEVQEYRIINIIEEPTDSEFITWLTDNAAKETFAYTGAYAFTVSSVDRLPYYAPDGSLALVESDSIIGKWEWKDNQSQLDFSMFNFPEDVSVYEEIYIDGAGFDGLLGAFASVCFTRDSGRQPDDITVTMEQTIYIDYSFCDAYTKFNLYSEPFYGKCTYITDDQFKAFIKTNCNRLSGGNSLYIRKNWEWVYNCEVS